MQRFIIISMVFSVFSTGLEEVRLGNFLNLTITSTGQLNLSLKWRQIMKLGWNVNKGEN